MLDFAVKVAPRSSEIGEPDDAVLAEHGFAAEDAWDIAALQLMARVPRS